MIESANQIYSRRRSKMTYILIGLLIISAVLAFIFAYLNDFSSDLHEILFPTVGALLFSFYLGLKATVIDAPETERFNITVGMMHDWKNGVLKSMYSYPLIGNNPESMDRFLGVKEIETVVMYDAFKSLNLSSRLILNSTNEIGSTRDIKSSVIEFLIFNWMNRFCRYAENAPELVYGLAGYGGGIAVIQDPEIFSEISLNASGNILIDAYPQVMKVPRGTVQSTEVIDQQRWFAFESSNYKLKFHVRPGPGGVFDPRINSLSAKVNEAMQYPSNPESHWLDVFVIEVEFQRGRLRRFSKISKLTSEWFHRIDRQMTKDFSWDLLRKEYSK